MFEIRVPTVERFITARYPVQQNRFHLISLYMRKKLKIKILAVDQLWVGIIIIADMASVYSHVYIMICIPSTSIKRVRNFKNINADDVLKKYNRLGKKK